ncbi:MAG: lactate racemase domain-containing protein [Rhodopila sp.]|nr:lactate racemase domain-containing protein [Rhodopila sp.]
MSIVEGLLQDVALPRMIRVRQNFAVMTCPDVAAAVRAECRKPAIAGRIRPGARVAVAVGSRGVADLPILVRTVVEELRAQGAIPFAVPAMGSHGGATAAGQVDLLAGLGVTEASVGCPIVSSMETVRLGTMAGTGLPVLMDRHAMGADGIVVINRVKPHTSFSGPIESGLVKMITIGLGKQKGADSCHSLGFGQMARNIVAMAEIKLREAPFLFGLASIENAYDRVARVVAVPAEDILAAEPQLLVEARANMPRIQFNPLDVLVVDRMGKEYSGAGMDPNITGRGDTPFVKMTQSVASMAVLDLSEISHGNASGMGLAEVCTRRLFDKVDFETTYANATTAAVLAGARIPVIMESDRAAVQLAVRTCACPDMSKLRLVRIKNTLHLETILISEAMLHEALGNPDISVLGPAEDWGFDERGSLLG